jgi:excisionase family DNA binding protein
MSTAKAKPKPAKSLAAIPAHPRDVNQEVLTLAETATYLRVSEADVLRMIQDQGLVGRQIGSDWRFLKSALQDWLRTPMPKSSKEALLGMVGKFKDDPFLEEITRETYRQRGRPMTEDGE